jgi:hypothetical protein
MHDEHTVPLSSGLSGLRHLEQQMQISSSLSVLATSQTSFDSIALRNRSIRSSDSVLTVTILISGESKEDMVVGCARSDRIEWEIAGFP